MKTQLISQFKGSYTILYRSWVLNIMIVFSILVFLLYLQSCGYYYKIKTQRNLINPKTLETIDLSGKYVILRSHAESNNLPNLKTAQ